jgi:hypothetical protein
METEDPAQCSQKPVTGPIHILFTLSQPVTLRSIVRLISLLHLHVQSGLFPGAFQSKYYMHLLFPHFILTES